MVVRYEHTPLGYLFPGKMKMDEQDIHNVLELAKNNQLQRNVSTEYACVPRRKGL
jgi:hypothetical protein